MTRSRIRRLFDFDALAALFLALMTLLPSPSEAQLMGYQSMTTIFGPKENVIGTDYLSSLPSGTITIQGKNLCPMNWNGGTLYQADENGYYFTKAQMIDGELYGYWPTVAPAIISYSGSYIHWVSPIYGGTQGPVPPDGIIATIANLYEPVIYVHQMVCYYTQCTDASNCQWNGPYHISAINLNASFDLAVASVSINQPPGTLAPIKDGKPVLKVGQAAEAVVTISGSNISASDTRTSSVVLTYADRNLSVPFSITELSSSQKSKIISFMPSSQFGLEDQTLSVAVNSDNALNESNTSNNTLEQALKVYTVCSVAAKGRNIPFFPQVGSSWSADVYGVTHPPRADRYISGKGCALASLSMVASSYGITTVADGSPLNPGTLNAEFKTFNGGISYTPANNIDWAGAVNNLRADYVEACVRGGENRIQCQNQIYGKVSFVGKFNYDQKAIEDEICSGNPVILNVTKNSASTPSHFVLATETDIDKDTGEKTFRIKDPGTINGNGVLLTKDYRSNPSYRLLRSAYDPSMFFIYGSENIDFVITDSQGRRAGVNPITKETFNEIPGANYYVDTIESDDPTDVEHDDAERVFQNLQPIDGAYRIDVYSVSGGAYTVETRSYDVNGQYNSRVAASGTLAKNGHAQSTYSHSSNPLPTSMVNSTIKVRDGHISSGTSAHLYVAGTIKPNSSSLGKKLPLKTTFEFKIGDKNAITRSIPFSKFIKIPFIGCSLYNNSKDHLWIGVCQGGKFWVFNDKLNVGKMSDSERSKFSLKVDSWSGETTIDSSRHKTCKSHHEGF